MHIVSNTPGAGGSAEALTVTGNFRIVEQLGSRLHANVYAGEHIGLERRVTVRVLKRELVGDEQATARFVAEAKVGSRLRSPHVPEIFDIGQLADGRRYYAVEALHGSSLEALLDGAGSIPLPRALRLIEGIGAALESAHAAGIIHRDLRPANISVESRGELEHPMVLGFGEPPADDGEVAYRSPEQGCGVDAKIDPRTDLYALGAILYRMLAGRPPFAGGTSGELLLAQMTSVPTPLCELDAEIPVSIEAAVARALARDPAQRHANVRELLDELRAASSPAPSANSPAPIADEPWFDAEQDPELAPSRRSFVRSPAGIGAVTTSVIGIGLALVLIAGRRTPPVAAPPSSPVAVGAPAVGVPAVGVPAVGVPAVGVPAVGAAAVGAAAAPVAAPPGPDATTGALFDASLSPSTARKTRKDPARESGTAMDGWHAVEFPRRAQGGARKPPSIVEPARRKPPSDDAKRMLAYPE